MPGSEHLELPQAVAVLGGAGGTVHATGIFLAAIGGAAVARTDPARTGVSAGLAIQPQSPGLAARIWWGSGTRAQPSGPPGRG